METTNTKINHIIKAIDYLESTVIGFVKIYGRLEMVISVEDCTIETVYISNLGGVQHTFHSTSEFIDEFYPIPELYNNYKELKSYPFELKKYFDNMNL